MVRCGQQFANYTKRFCSSKAAAETSSGTRIMQGLNENAHAITAVSIGFGGTYYLARRHVTQEAQVNFLKECLLEKEKTAIEKAKALEMVATEKEKALERLATEKEKNLEKMLAEKEKTQAAEKRELEARIRELEAQIRFERPTAF